MPVQLKHLDRTIENMAEQQRRAAATPKNIEDIESQTDIRARVVGTVISMEDESVTIDDGTGSVEVFVQEEEMEDIEENQRIRVLGRILPTPESFEMQAEAVHELDDDEAELYDRVKKIVNTSE